MIKISRANFPATVVNARIAESINVFYDSMEDFFKKEGWKWHPFARKGDKWVQEDYTVEITGKYQDGAYREILFTTRRTPGLVGQSTKKEQMNIGYTHKFSIHLPRVYPANLSHIKMKSISKLWHPRISMSGRGDACITVNGEVDRILIDLIFHLLMDPKRIRPPKLYPKEDSGMNTLAMRWFEKDAENIHKAMLVNWDTKHDKASLKDGGGIKIIGGDNKKQASKEKSAIRIIPKEIEQPKDSSQKEEEKKKGGIRII